MQSYKTKGVCSRQINFEVDGDILTHLEFVGGCAGNTAGVAILAVGRNIDEIISLTKGVPCRGGTSCPDQLAKALTEYKLTK